MVSLTTTPAGTVDGPLLVTVMVYVVDVPAVTEVTPSVLVIARSAEVVTVFESVALLFAVVGSVVVELTEAVLSCGLTVVDAGTVYVTVTVAVLPELIVPSEHVKLGLPVHVPWDGLAVPRVNPAGQVSDNETAAAFDGPALDTVIV
jgi:hypothetical protein